MKLIKILSACIGVLMIVAGLYCLLSPTLTYLGVAYVIGVTMVIDGVGQLINWNQYRKAGVSDGWTLAGGILSIVFGVILLGDAALQLSVDVFIAYVIAIWILVRGIVSIVRAFRIRRFHEDWDTVVVGKRWWVMLLLGIVTCVFGVLALFNPGIIMAAIGIFIGLGIIFAGANMIANAVSSKS